MKVKKIRVAIIIDCYGGNFIGGGQIHLNKIKKTLEEKYNCNLDIFSQTKSGLFWRWIFSFWVILWVVVKNRNRKYDIIHSQSIPVGISAKIISLIIHRPVIHSVHGANYLEMERLGLKSKSIFYYLEKFVLTEIKYSGQISVAKNFLKYPNKNTRIWIIPNGVEISNYINKKINSNFVNLLFVGRLEKIKGLDILIKSLTKINFKYQLKIVGSGPEKENLIKLVKDKKLIKKIIFLGKKNGKNLEKEYFWADLFVLPSLTEGQPLTLLEAWAHKLPVLVTEVGHNPEMVVNSYDGFLVKPGQVSGLIRGLESAYNFRKKWRKIGENGYNKARKFYTWDMTAQKIFEVYKNVLNKEKYA